MGRSVAQFFLPGRTAESVLKDAHTFATAGKFRLGDSLPGRVTMTRGNKLVTFRRAINVGAWDAAGGANVLVEAWWETFLIPEMNANPNEIIGIVARRMVWGLASAFVRRLGVPPEAVFQHF